LLDINHWYDDNHRHEHLHHNNDLKHNNDDAFRMDSDEGTDVYPVIAALQRAIFENAKNRSRMRVSLRALRRDGMPRKVRGTHVMKT